MYRFLHLLSLSLILALTISLAWAQEVLTMAEKPFVPNNRWALVVGVSGYSDEIGRLKYTSKEAREFGGLLVDKLGFDASNVRTLADGGAASESPTSEHILGALDSILADKRLDKGNLFVFYFSGHGVGSAKGDLLLPLDTTKGRVDEMGVPASAVIERIANAGLRNVLFIADACRAGTENEFGAQLIELCRKTNIAVILGCAPGKRSYEYPELKQGAFTHFLIRSLGDPNLRDESGALWASSVGKDLQKRVFDFTEPDHGKFAQIPAVWAEQTTLDVLLGVYPRPPVSDFAIEAFKKNAHKLDTREFCVAMMAYANELSNNGRYDQCIDLLKAVDQFGELTPAGRYILANSLDFVGRTGESERVFAAFQLMPEDYYKNLALISSNSRDIAPRLRIEAANKIFRTDPNWASKMLAWLAIRRWGTYEEQLSFAKAFANVPGQTDRQRFYTVGCLAEIQGRWADSIAAFQASTKCSGTVPGNDVLFYSRLTPTLGLNDPTAVERLADEGLNQEDFAVGCYIQKAFLAKERGDDEGRIRLLREALKRNPSPEQLWIAVKTAGPYIVDLLKEVKDCAEGHPYSWRAQLLKFFVKQLGGNKTNVREDTIVQELYREDPLTYNSKIFDLMYSYLSECLVTHRVSELDYRRQVELYFASLLGSASKFGYDPELWMQLTQYGMLNERNMQLRAIVGKHLRFQPAAAPKSLRPLFMFLAMNSGDDATVQMLNAATFEPAELDDPSWLYAAYEAMRGHEVQAAQIVARLRPASLNLRPRMEALKTYLYAKTGKTAQARQRLLSKQVDDLVVRGFNGLTWAALKDWKNAEPLLQEQVKSRNWAFLFMSERAMGLLDGRYRKAGRMDDARNLALISAASQPGNPLFDKYSFVAKPGVAQFAGTVQKAAVLLEDRSTPSSVVATGVKAYVFGKLSMTVSRTGAFAGSFAEEGGKVHKFAGKVDPLGNLSGRTQWNGVGCKVAAKLAPAALYKTYSGFKELGQVIQLIDDDGYQISLVTHG